MFDKLPNCLPPFNWTQIASHKRKSVFYTLLKGGDDMFKKIMVPVDLANVAGLERALGCAADLAKLYHSPIVYVGVTSSGPTSQAPNPEVFHKKLSAFVEREVGRHGVKADAHTAIAHDLTTEVDDALFRAIDETQADLVVMASHIPGVLEYIWPSNGGKIAGHARCSVMLVRS